jgi:hypothetical protein
MTPDEESVREMLMAEVNRRLSALRGEVAKVVAERDFWIKNSISLTADRDAMVDALRKIADYGKPHNYKPDCIEIARDALSSPSLARSLRKLENLPVRYSIVRLHPDCYGSKFGITDAGGKLIFESDFEDKIMAQLAALAQVERVNP